MLRLSLIHPLFNALLIVSTLFVFAACGQVRDTSLIELGDGLSLQLPPGWAPVTLSTDVSTRANSRPSEDPQPVDLLLHARPSDLGRKSALTVVRDDISGSNFTGRRSKGEQLMRVSEIAAAQGYRVDKFSTKESSEGPQSVILTEAEAVSAEGARRIFTCVSVNQSPRLSLRCYWQRDAKDAAAQGEFDSWLASVSFSGKNVANALAASAMHVQTPSRRGFGSPRNASVLSDPSAGGEFTSSRAGDSADVGELVNKLRGALVLVEGAKGQGSGFLYQQAGQTWLVTNAHVLANNPNPRLTTLDRQPFALGEAALAVGHDVCRIKVAPNPSAPELLANMDSMVRVGDAIVVPGNSEGAGVVRPLTGRIVGLGPDLVEVDAPFVPGNSGSPIIHQPTGKVIGVATYIVTRKVDSQGTGKVDTAIRRFGYRMDSIKAWEAVNWPRFFAQSAQAQRIEESSAEFIKLFEDAKQKQLSSGNFTTSGLRRALENMESRIRTGGRTMSATDMANVRRQLMSDLRVATRADISAFDFRSAHDYFRRTVAEEQKFRDALYEAFTRAIDTVGR